MQSSSRGDSHCPTSEEARPEASAHAYCTSANVPPVLAGGRQAKGRKGGTARKLPPGPERRDGRIGARVSARDALKAGSK